MRLLQTLQENENLLIMCAAVLMPLAAAPGLTLCGLLPCLSAHRYHVLQAGISVQLTDAILLGILLLLWCLLLELRRRRLDELLECVSGIEAETSRLVAEQGTPDATTTCVELLDACCDEYDQLELLHGACARAGLTPAPPSAAPPAPALAYRLHHPPIIEESSSES